MPYCPKCGYREVDWPSILLTIAFGTLYLTFMLVEDSAPRGYREAAMAAFLMFLAAGVWRNLKATRNKRDYEKLHPPSTERLKNHIRAHRS